MKRLALVVLVTGVAACDVTATATAPRRTEAPPNGGTAMTFEQEVAFLREHGAVQVLERPGGGRIAISPDYQARVMTSAVEPGGQSIGWVNHKFIRDAKTGTQFDNYGGEDRFWLGPEGGQHGLYFPPGKPFEIASWQTPHALQEGRWAAADGGKFARQLEVTNYSGAKFEVAVERTIRLLEDKDVAERLGVAAPAGVKWVGYESENRITNRGTAPWAKETGLLSIWILAMYNPSPDMRIVVPFEPGSGEIVNDRYFGKVPADRLVVKADHLVFTGDGLQRGKIGLGPARARRVLGSYSASARLLTIVHYDKPDGAKDYVNSMWENQKDPLAGDTVNSYNDGPTEPGKASLGGFYELETSSPAAALAPSQSMTHTHRTFHFVGDRAALDVLATKALGVSLSSL